MIEEAAVNRSTTKEKETMACLYCQTNNAKCDRRRRMADHRVHVVAEHIRPLNVCMLCLQYDWSPLDRKIHGAGSGQCTPQVCGNTQK